MKGKRIDQLMPTISHGDAISNNALAIKKMLQSLGCNSDIYAQNIHPKVANQAKHISEFRASDDKDTIIYHFSTGSDLNDLVTNLKSKKKAMIYHNITPEHFFFGYNTQSYNLCKQGREQLLRAKDAFSIALADSEYNRAELESIGFINTHAMPLIIKFDEYKQPADSALIEKYKDGNTNLLFVGRITPNKKQEDVIKTFYYYKKYIDQNSRLFLVGSYDGMERYYKRLLNFVDYLGLEDVYFTGHISFRELLAYYQIADVFLCMSEHEGFCVPLVESMYFKVPIIAYNSTAVPETLGDSGILFNEKSHIEIAELISIMQQDTDFKQSIIQGQTVRLGHFNEESANEKLRFFINKLMG